MYKFVCSRRLIDIDTEEGFASLVGDELSELLCEDPKLISWFEPQHLAKMTGFDMVTVLAIHPHLIGYFYGRLKDKRTTKRTDWSYLIQFRPDFEVLSPF